MLNIRKRFLSSSAQPVNLRSLSGDALGCMPLLETLDLSWNTGVGGALQSLLGKLQPSLRELHLVDCCLSDAAALGTDRPCFRCNLLGYFYCLDNFPASDHCSPSFLLSLLFRWNRVCPPLPLRPGRVVQPTARWGCSWFQPTHRRPFPGCICGHAAFSHVWSDSGEFGRPW